MVLEFIFGSKQVRKHPIFLLFQSILLSSISLWVASAVFPDSASIAAIAFLTIGLVPLLEKILSDEEEEEEENPGSTVGFLARHSDIIAIYSWFFIGLIISYSFWFYALPETGGQACIGDFCISMPSKEKVFSEQAGTLTAIKGAFSISPQSSRSDCFGSERSVGKCTEYIFANNAVVLGLAILFCFLYGAGAIFLLAWNASVIGVLLGQKAIELQGYHLGLTAGIGLVPHGVPEIISYFIGAIAGGIISAAIIRGKFQTKAFEQIAKDAILLIIAAYVLLFVAALIEAMVIVGG